MEENTATDVKVETAEAEASPEVTQQDSKAEVNSQLGVPEDNITDNIDDLNEGFDYKPLFESEAVDEAELKGEVVTGDDEASPEPIDDKPKEDQQASEEIVEDDSEKKSDEEAPIEVVQKLAEKETQISGLNTALHRERQTVRQLRDQLQRVADEVETLKTQSSEADKFKDFKVLSDEEYENLVDEDPEEGQKYLYRLNRFEAHKAKQEQLKNDLNQNTAKRQEFIDEGLNALEKVIPGITGDSKPEIVGNLIEFSIKHGLAEDVLAIITDPKSSIVSPSGESYLLGPEAANITKFVKSVFDAVSTTPNKDAIRAEIEAELRPKIETEIQKTFLEKLKANPSGNFRSLDMAPGGSKDTKVITGVLSESNYAKLTPQEQEAYLAGT